MRVPWPLLRAHPPLMVVVAGMALLVVVSAGGLVLDDRVLLDVPVWVKPLKFAVSFIAYGLTFAWLLSLLDAGRRRLGRRLGTVIAVTAALEMVVIVGQVVRGRQSHFNTATALDSALFALMGATVVVLWLASLGIAVLLLLQRLADRPTALAVRLGLVIALGGLAVGFLMTKPTPDQAAAMVTAPPATVGAHSVGVPDGGPGLPLVNWSTEGGDLRVGHFVGMHALQVLPLLAVGLAGVARRVRRLRPAHVRARLVTVGAAGYAGLTLLVTWQALRGQSLVHPDALTLGAAAVLLVGASAGALWAVVGAAREPAAVVGPRSGPAGDKRVPAVAR